MVEKQSWPYERSRSDLSCFDLCVDVAYGSSGSMGHCRWFSLMGACGEVFSPFIIDNGNIQVHFLGYMDNIMQVLLLCRTQQTPLHHAQCSATDSVRSIRVTPHVRCSLDLHAEFNSDVTLRLRWRGEAVVTLSSMYSTPS